MLLWTAAAEVFYRGGAGKEEEEEQFLERCSGKRWTMHASNSAVYFEYKWLKSEMKPLLALTAAFHSRNLFTARPEAVRWEHQMRDCGGGGAAAAKVQFACKTFTALTKQAAAKQDLTEEWWFFACNAAAAVGNMLANIHSGFSLALFRRRRVRRPFIHEYTFHDARFSVHSFAAAALIWVI